MPQYNHSRRGFLVGCSAAIAGMAGARLNQVVFGSPEAEPNQEILITVFLRGACDVLSLIPPIGGDDRGFYEAARVDLRIPASGTGAALPLGTSAFGLHPSATGLYDLYQANKLAIVQAVGMNEDTRSHFDAMSYMELGTPGSKSATNGWLTRHLQSAPNLPPNLIMPALAAGGMPPTSFLSSREVLTLNSAGSFNLNTGPWQWRDAQRQALRHLYGGTTSLHKSGIQSLNAVDVIETYNSTYTPANGAVYPTTGFGDQLKLLAQMIKLQLGLQVATIDLGGWDTHENQASGSTGYFADLVGQMSQGLSALYTDLDGAGSDNYTQRLTVVVMSEFGRRLRENSDRGTDHGHGSAMLVMGGNVNGGLFGTWPGLSNEQLYDAADLAVTTDYRQVLSEILIRRLGNPNLCTVFPGYTGYTPLGVVQGVDLEPVCGGGSSVYLPFVRQ